MASDSTPASPVMVSTASRFAAGPGMPALAVDTPLIFVTGASRSGTTMLARMLGSHAAIRTFDELHYFGALWDPQGAPVPLPVNELARLAAILVARHRRGLWCGTPSAEERSWAETLVAALPAEDGNAAGLFAAVMRTLAADDGKTTGCEQTPRNIFYAKRLLELYPSARIVHIVRDPRAVLASQKNRWKLRQMGAEHLPRSEMLRNWVNYHPYTMSKLWAKATQEAHNLSGHPRVLVIRFEDLAAEPEARMRTMCEFLGIDYEPAMLDVPRWGSSNVKHSSESKGVAKEVVGKWRESLTTAEALICEPTTRQMMAAFDYAPEFLDRPGFAATLPSWLLYPLHAAGVVALNPGRAWVQVRALLGAGKA